MDSVTKAQASGSSSVFELHEVERLDDFANQGITTPNNSSTSNNNYVSKTNMEVVDVAKNNIEDDGIQFEVQLPQGVSLTSISGIDIPCKEIGNLFQFLEFYSTFGKVLNLRDGQAISTVQELFSSSCIKRQQYSSIISIMIQLLDLISKDRDMTLSLSATNNNWFAAIGDLLLKSRVLSDDFPPETFEVGGVAKYKEMDASRKLKLLNFLCDESLSTWIIRDYIKYENAKCEAEKKEAKQNVAAANKKEKQLRKTMKSDIAKAHMENTGATLSIEEHNAIMSQLRAEVKEAHEEMLEAKDIASRKMQRCDVVRTNPIILDDNGLVLWKLKCFEEEPKFLLQDLGRFDDLNPHEKWIAFKAEQKQEIEKFISSKRMKLMRTPKNANSAAS